MLYIILTYDDRLVVRQFLRCRRSGFPVLRAQPLMKEFSILAQVLLIYMRLFLADWAFQML